MRIVHHRRGRPGASLPGQYFHRSKLTETDIRLAAAAMRRACIRDYGAAWWRRVEAKAKRVLAERSACDAAEPAPVSGGGP